MIGTMIRQYRIIAELTPGKGGMGDLYLAEHVSLPKRFAIKCVKPALTQDPKFCERFYQEAQNQALLDHPNIVQAIDFFEENGQFFFVMQFIQGQDLDSLIKSCGKLGEQEALRIFQGILEGLQFAHSKGIVHRDMKPSNVLIDEDGRCRITDFGIATLAGAERLTATGVAIGTPWYMSPEQITHPKAVGPRSDIYSAGIVLYEMLTGDVPFDGETDFAVKEKQVNAPTPNPRQKNPAISQELAEIICKAMAKEPAQRFQTCGEMLACIHAYLGATEQPPTLWSTWRLVTAAVLSSALLVGGGLFVYEHFFSGNSGENLGAGSIGGQDLDAAQRSAADTLIAALTDRVAMACRELPRIKEFEKIQRNAENLGETGFAAEYAKQVDNMKKNVSDWNAEYLSSLARLLELKPATVARQFDGQERELLAKESFDNAKSLGIARHHYNQALSGGKVEIALDAAACSVTPGVAEEK